MTSSFRNLTISNLLMYISQYMLFPVIPVAMADKMDMSVAQTGATLGAFLLGMMFIGPLTGYLLDTLRRKGIALNTLVILALITAVYGIITKPEELVVMMLVQGGAYTLTGSVLLTLSIDITVSAHRTKANMIFGWYTRVGMITGIAAGSTLYLNFGIITVLWVSGIITILGILMLLPVHVPFRAPIGVGLIMLDRFFMPRSWVLAINMFLISLIPGLLLPLMYFKISDIFLSDTFAIPYFLIVLIGFVIYFPLANYFFESKDIKKQILTGLSLIVISVCFLFLIDLTIMLSLSALFLGLGIAFTTTPFLWMFIGLSRHCERATANASNLLSWHAGLIIGIIISCYLKPTVISGLLPFQLCIPVASFAVIFFIMAAFPYYHKKKVR